MESIFTLEPVEHLKDVMLALVDATLTDAVRISQQAGGDLSRQLAACLEALTTLEDAALTEAAKPLEPYICQLEFAFLKLARQAFGQHCAINNLPEATMDMSFEDADIEILPAELTGEVLRYFAAEPCVANSRYFDYEPINKSVMMQRAFRAGLHAMVLRHVRFIPIKQATPVPRQATPVPRQATPITMPPPQTPQQQPAWQTSPRPTPLPPAGSPVNHWDVSAAAHQLSRLARGTPQRTPQQPTPLAAQPSPMVREHMEHVIRTFNGTPATTPKSLGWRPGA